MLSALTNVDMVRDVEGAVPYNLLGFPARGIIKSKWGLPWNVRNTFSGEWLRKGAE